MQKKNRNKKIRQSNLSKKKGKWDGFWKEKKVEDKKERISSKERERERMTADEDKDDKYDNK